MKILGLTGSIGMGKSTASAMVRRLGVPVHDADATVHRLMAVRGRAVPAIAAAFPGVVRDGAVNRRALGAVVFADPKALRRLEAILHPLVHQDEQVFLRRCARRRSGIVALDVPLLLETGGQKRCDRVAVVSCPAFLQKQRVLARPGMTSQRLAAILSQQMPDQVKRRLAHGIIPTGCGRGVTLRHLQRLLKDLASEPARLWPPCPRPRYSGSSGYTHA